jgi:hypothetical protein
MIQDDDVAAAILGYLEEHPYGMDTLEGITEWWLSRQQIRVQVATVTRVLQRLTEGGALEVIANGAHCLYRRKGWSAGPDLPGGARPATAGGRVRPYARKRSPR